MLTANAASGARTSDPDPVVRRRCAGSVTRAATTLFAAMRGTGAAEHASRHGGAFVPLSFAPGEAYQFDWSHEIVVMSGVTVTVKVAHMRLCHSRMMFCPGLSA